MTKVSAYFLAVLLAVAGTARATEIPGAPSLCNNPSLDVIVTNPRPVLSFFNAGGGRKPRTYTIQLSTDPRFKGPDLITYQKVPEGKGRVTAKRIEPGRQLKDGVRYCWRVRAIDADGRRGAWAASRFYVDCKSDDSFMGLKRVVPRKVTVSSGFNPKNICDLDDPGQASFWQSAPFDEQNQWVQLDLGSARRISRIWMLSSISDRNGWLRDAAWQISLDGENWQNVPGAALNGNDTFRNILDFPPVTARHWRLFIKGWQGYAAQINALCLYEPGEPPVPTAPAGPYVLVVGDQSNGFTFTQLARRVRSLGLGLKTIRVPHYEVSLKMVRGLNPQPVAIILSGNNASYQNLPMFEYNGVFELVRHCKIPMLGICAGHQMTVFAYGLTFARSMGWSDITALDPRPWRRKAKILLNDPLFKGVADPFVAVEVHGWAVYILPEHYQVLAESSYVQAIRRDDKMLYGTQFHPEIEAPYNQAGKVLVNFLKMSMKKRGN